MPNMIVKTIMDLEILQLEFPLGKWNLERIHLWRIAS